MARILKYHVFAPGDGPVTERIRRSAAMFERDLGLLQPGDKVTIDDGRISAYQFAYPLLQKHGIRATFFIASNLIGQPYFMTWADVTEVARDHDIECHTHTHPDLTTLDEQGIRWELATCCELIASHTGRAPHLLAPPMDRSNPGVEQIARELGMEVIPNRTTVFNDTDLDIASCGYWDSIFSGKVKAEPGGHESDRFAEVLAHLEGNVMADIGAGHAQLARQIKERFPLKTVYAVDFSAEAARRSGYEPYLVSSCYDLPFKNKELDLLISCQMMEFIADENRFLAEARRVAKKAILTVPHGVEGACSQLRTYSLNGLRHLLEPFGTIEQLYLVHALVFAKLSLTGVRDPEARGAAQIQAYYDQLWRGPAPAYDAARNEQLMRYARPADRLLDLGAGVNGTFEWHLRSKNGGGDLWAVDTSAAARQAVLNAIRPDEKLNYITSTAEETPFRNGYFDGVVCGGLIECVESPRALVAEIARVTKPGGWIGLSSAIHSALDDHHRIWRFEGPELTAMLEPWGTTEMEIIPGHYIVHCRRNSREP